VEAGLRSFDRRMPEEINRVLVDHCSDRLLCPTPTAVQNLRIEGITAGVHLTGDVMADILGECLSIAERQSPILSRLHLEPGGYLLTTLHRAENTDDPARLRSILRALQAIADDIPLVFPCHPRTEARLASLGLLAAVRESLTLIPPVGYLDMLVLEKNAHRILTDSGGVQKRRSS
jgi:UDP-N-acetylglucosamine 2-epimerase